MKKIGFKIYETISQSLINPRVLSKLQLNSINFSMNSDSLIVKEIKKYGYDYYLEFIRLYHDDAWQIIVSSQPLLKIKTIDNFWINWNKFKILKGFI